MPATAAKVLSHLSFARNVLHTEAEALRTVADRLDEQFEVAVELVLSTSGRVCVSGVGKSADVGRKIVSTLNSTGTRAYTLDVTSALHGDLGAVHPDDVALLLSHSGESEELLRLLGPLRAQCACIIAITSTRTNSLARTARATIAYGAIIEACPHALAPTTSTTVMLALGDALALTVSDRRGFGPEDFARYHPAGSLGRKLARVETLMRTGRELRFANVQETVREVFARSSPGRRTGAVMVTADDGTLAGIFTDSDLARLFETRHDTALDSAIGNVMTRQPITTTPLARVGEVIELLRARKISEVPVVDDVGKPVGLLDITDVIGLDSVLPAGKPALRISPVSA